jgi:competence protein ComEC
LSERGLYLGFVVGDTRLLSVETAALFQRVGLTHLLAVSGANVAFVLAAAAPLLRRMRLRGRAIGALAVIGFFATVTRFEPSVLRASAMAAVAVLAQAAGRPSSGLRLLALATTALVLVDPFLVWSIGFRLSVGASLGILAFAAPIARRCPGPRWLAEPLSVTAAAQIGVAPVAIPVFGGLPAAALPANLLVAPVVGPLMMWGLVAGTVAGALGERAAGALHVPTHLAISWVRLVAHATDALPAASIGGPAALGGATVVLAVIAARWRRLGSPPWRSSSGTPASTSRHDRS